MAFTSLPELIKALVSLEFFRNCTGQWTQGTHFRASSLATVIGVEVAETDTSFLSRSLEAPDI